MKVQRILSLAAVGIASLALVACSQEAPSVLGQWGSPEVAQEPALTFESDGTLHGTDGCNNLMGNYTTEGSKVSFGGLASTMMFCEGVDDWLVRGHSATIDGDVLTVFDEAGKEIGSLARIVN